MTPSNTPLSISNATVTYPDGLTRFTALDSVSLELDAGELGFVVGESGSGKSTLLSVAGGLISPDSGTVHVAGEKLTDDNRAAVRRDHIGIIFQQANLIGSLTAAEQLLVTDHIRGVRPAAIAPTNSWNASALKALAIAPSVNSPAGNASASASPAP